MTAKAVLLLQWGIDLGICVECHVSYSKPLHRDAECLGTCSGSLGHVATCTVASCKVEKLCASLRGVSQRVQDALGTLYSLQEGTKLHGKGLMQLGNEG